MGGGEGGLWLVGEGFGEGIGRVDKGGRSGVVHGLSDERVRAM